jgi:hypothetical protein
LNIFDLNIKRFATRHPAWKHTVDIVTGGASVTQSALILRQEADAQAQTILGNMQKFASQHSLEVHATQAYRDVLVQVQWCSYSGLLEASVRLPASSQGLMELAQSTPGGSYSILQSGAPLATYSDAMSTHEIAQFQTRQGYLAPGFTPEQLRQVIAQWGPKSNSQADVAEISQVTNKLVGSIRMDAADAPREMASSKVTSWVTPIVNEHVAIDFISPPMANQALDIKVETQVKK